jgi:hypothetical protein
MSRAASAFGIPSARKVVASLGARPYVIVRLRVMSPSPCPLHPPATVRAFRARRRQKRTPRRCAALHGLLARRPGGDESPTARAEEYEMPGLSAHLVEQLEPLRDGRGPAELVTRVGQRGETSCDSRGGVQPGGVDAQAVRGGHAAEPAGRVGGRLRCAAEGGIAHRAAHPARDDVHTHLERLARDDAASGARTYRSLTESQFFNGLLPS